MALKQYRALSLAGSQLLGGSQVSPATPSRSFLFIQNTGANPGLLQFKNPVKNDGSDLLIISGASFRSDQTYSDDTLNGPIESINLASTLGTTWAIIEITREGKR